MSLSLNTRSERRYHVTLACYGEVRKILKGRRAFRCGPWRPDHPGASTGKVTISMPSSFACSAAEMPVLHEVQTALRQGRVQA